MLKQSAIILFLGFTFFLASCSSDTYKKEDLDVVTERIQYDVTIKTPDPDMDWWVQNIEGQRREQLIAMILNKAYEGKVQAYNYFDQPMTPEEVQAIGVRNDTLIMPSMLPPYEDSVVVINERLRVNDIERIRFLEEWHINPATLSIKKNVLGMALMLTDFDTAGELRGYRHLFWIYFDDRYPKSY